MINIKIDSRKVVEGDTFVAIRGNTVDGHTFIPQVVEKGAKCVVVDHEVETDVEQIIVEDTQEWLTNHIAENYSKEVNEMNIVGITGTNGKTTTAYLTYQLLNELGSKTAYIGTIGFYIPGKDKIELPNTTPNILDLYDLILTAKAEGCTNLIMEVSSHALHQSRVKGLKFKVGAFTNLTQDHLDYHKTMESYLDAKLLLLNQLEGPMIVNADDKYHTAWAKENVDIKKLGYNAEDYKINTFTNVPGGTKVEFTSNDKTYEVLTNLKNEFNVYNYLTSLAIAANLGYSIEEIINVTPKVTAPKGRCEIIKVREAEAVIDYAHTPDAVEKIITSFKKVSLGKVYTLVGCGGDRDATKRPIMGRIATENSDYVVFTSDNPRTEDPNKILEDILAGVEKDNYTVITDRREAIAYILDMLNDNDTALILGKGHEDYQIIGREKTHLDDAEEVMKYNLKRG